MSNELMDSTATSSTASTYDVNNLNPGQKLIYDQLLSQLTSDVDQETGRINKSKVITLDAPPGTGKSHLITTLAHSADFKQSILVIAFCNNIVDSFIENGLASQTNYSFLNDNFTFMADDRFKECKKLFSDEATLEQSLLKAYKNILDLKIPSDILILDEYTVTSPWLLLCLAFAGRRLNKHIIFLGDGDQLNSIDRSRYHHQTNRTLANEISDQSYTLEQQMRIFDPAFSAMIADLKKKFHPFKETDLTFDIIFCLYTHMKDKFFTDDFNALFLSGYHNNLKIRKAEIDKYRRSNRNGPDALNKNLYQYITDRYEGYPLSTYHAILGSTINEAQIVLDLSNQAKVKATNNVKANAMYVGLSRLRVSNQLAGIKYPWLLSLIYTELLNDEYYYYITDYSFDGWKEAIWECGTTGISQLPAKLKIQPIYTVREIKAFSNMKVNCRILRSAFNRKSYKCWPTTLVKIARFLKDHDFLLEKIHDYDEVLKYFSEYNAQENADNGNDDEYDEPANKRRRIE